MMLSVPLHLVDTCLLTEQMKQYQHGVGFSATESGFQLDNRLSAFASQSLDSADEEPPHTFR